MKYIQNIIIRQGTNQNTVGFPVLPVEIKTGDISREKSKLRSLLVGNLRQNELVQNQQTSVTVKN